MSQNTFTDYILNQCLWEFNFWSLQSGRAYGFIKARLVSMEIDSSTNAAIASSVIEFLVAAVTLFRLALRLRIRRLWWEDMWAAIAMVAAMAFAINIMVFYLGPPRNFIALFIAEFASVLWSVRMSVLYSVIRITPPCTRIHKVMRATGALFIIVWALQVILKTLWCMEHLTFQLGPVHRPTCHMSYSLAVSETIADFVGDMILVGLSLKLLWRVKLRRRQRRMILSTFVSTVIMSVTSLVHAIGKVAGYGSGTEIIFTGLELISSLIVCNLLVVVTYIYRLCRCSPESEESPSDVDDDFTTPISRNAGSTRSQNLTTVNLDDGLATTGHFDSGALTSPISSAAY